MDRAAQLMALLAAAGNRITPEREAICRVLAECREHPAPLTLYGQVKRRYPDISRATVYNTLNLLRALGAVTELGLDGEGARYETDPHPHANLICLRCGRIEDLDDPLVDALSRRLAGDHGLALRAARMDIYGYCRACQATTPSP